MTTARKLWLCRAAFLLLCAAPTVGVVGLVIQQQAAQATAAVQAAAYLPRAEKELARLLGVRVELGRMLYPQPGLTRLEAVTLHDPETGAVLAEAASAEMAYAERGRLVVELTGVVLPAEHLPRLTEILHGRVLRDWTDETPVVEASCPSAQIVGEPRDETLVDIRLRIAPRADGRAAEMTFRPAWSESRDPLRLIVARTQNAGRPHAGVTLETGSLALPTSWLSIGLPPDTAPDDESTFRGTIHSDETPAGWETQVSGRFSGVPLDRLVARRLRPFPLGAGELQINHARWRGNRLCEAEGWLKAGPADVGWSLLTEATQTLGLRAVQPPLPGDGVRQAQPVACEMLCAFALDESGLALLGDARQNGVVLRNAEAAWLVEPAGKVAWTTAQLDLLADLGLTSLDFVPVRSAPPVTPSATLRLRRGN